MEAVDVKVLIAAASIFKGFYFYFSCVEQDENVSAEIPIKENVASEPVDGNEFIVGSYFWNSLKFLMKLVDSPKVMGTGRLEKTLELFEEIVGWGFQPDRFTYGKAVQAAVKLGDLDRRFEIVQSLKRRGVSPNVFVYNVLVSGLCKERKMGMRRRCCDGEGVMALYEEACGRGVRINGYTCSILLNALCKEGEVEKAEEILEKEMENGLVPNEVVFTTILNGYC
ncbi:hypothetical protein Patl1_36634 [Pistacia atlantica]|nr:hypothetical protein Patl1_36634 [Pistacia atlantica]